MSLVKKIKQHGVRGSLKIAIKIAGRKIEQTKRNGGWYSLRVRNVPIYSNPTKGELAQIEATLRELGVVVKNYAPSVGAFTQFQANKYFPADYYCGIDGGAWDEKLLEHFIAAEKLGLMEFTADDIYVDIAAGGSPWVQTLRSRLGLDAYAIDLSVSDSYRSLPYYRQENATATSFPDQSLRGASLQCAFEMFMGNDDSRFIDEVARILAPGGKIVILPLYMHTHYCAFSSPDCCGKGYPDSLAKEYVYFDHWGIPSARMYDARTLKLRILDPIIEYGMQYRISVLRNKESLGKDIYCHFILEIIR